jgi:hypothetical protein
MRGSRVPARIASAWCSTASFTSSGTTGAAVAKSQSHTTRPTAGLAAPARASARDVLVLSYATRGNCRGCCSS